MTAIPDFSADELQRLPPYLRHFWILLSEQLAKKEVDKKESSQAIKPGLVASSEVSTEHSGGRPE